MKPADLGLNCRAVVMTAERLTRRERRDPRPASLATEGNLR